ncbi:ligand-binding sensor domain-containing diguanylate cyclase [Alkalimonas sp.]|uniref:ligand-binding sensor domain-containing diguanylate cyclase n=1 Tax=Alkalimonas sp. TaxID=1872453 RepID=UPI00263A64EF|nr:ligand-binding sensor domain-containing diguanylate cyclase [Alkalimonas sp.]MCC5825701.1 diguanylate cyclase [Alkalimonas sp.]
MMIFRSDPIVIQGPHLLFGTLCRKLGIILGALCYLLSLPLVAVPQSDSLQHFFLEQWTTRDGLPHNTINSIEQTDDGYLWFATWEGIARFNGRSFTLFDRSASTGLPDSGIFALHATSANTLIAGGSRGGLVRYQNNQWTPLPVAGALVRAVLQDQQQRLWIATESAGLWRQEPDGQRYRISGSSGLNYEAMYSLAEGPQGRVWVGSSEGLFLVRDNHVRHFQTADGLPPGPAFSIALDAQEQTIVATEQGVFIGNEQQGFQPLHPELTMAASALLVEGDTLWIGTLSDGLFRYNPAGLEALGTDSNKPANRILALRKDNEGSLWVGTNGGLFRLRNAPFTSITTQHGLADNFVRAVLPLADGSVLAGTSRGVAQIRNQLAVPFDHPEPFLRESILSMAEDQAGQLWFGSYAYGLLAIAPDGSSRLFDRNDGLWTNEVRSILPAADGSLWIGTSRGLNRWYQGQMERLDMESGLPGNYIMALYQSSDGRIWIGTGTGVAFWQDGDIHTLNLFSQDGAEFAFGFLELPQQQFLWMATDRGLVRYDLNSGALSIIGRGAGLPFDKYFQVVADKQNNLWLTSNRGILQFSLQDALAVLNNQKSRLPFEHFSEGDGMLSAQANGGSNPAAALHPDGSIWVATAGGVVFSHPERLSSFSSFIPPVVIEQIRVDGELQQLVGPLKLAAGTQRIELHYAGLGFVLPQHIQYRTRLIGFDNDWVEREQQPYAELTNLAPGHYTFEVIAAYPGGAWSETSASFSFHIAPHLWQRPGFWLLMLALLSLALLLLFRMRLRRLELAALELKRQVAEKTAQLQLKADHLEQTNTEKSGLLEQLRLQSEAFAKQARQDPLTGLANRRVFDEVLLQEFNRAKRHQHPLCLALIDIDFFKQVNDRWSHSVGDEVLIRVGRSLQQQCRNTDTVSRWGGEEFALLLPETGLPEVLQLCERLRSQISQLDFSDIASDLRITVSIGVAECQDSTKADRLLGLADKALYQAKAKGRNQVCVSHAQNKI